MPRIHVFNKLQFYKWWNWWNWNHVSTFWRSTFYWSCVNSQKITKVLKKSQILAFYNLSIQYKFPRYTAIWMTDSTSYIGHWLVRSRSDWFRTLTVTYAHLVVVPVYWSRIRKSFDNRCWEFGGLLYHQLCRPESHFFYIFCLLCGSDVLHVSY